MTASEFIELVGTMRTLQKLYFKKRDCATLIECKRLEAEVDKYLEAHDAR